MSEKEEKKPKKKVTIYLEADVWKRFLDKVYERNGRTHGGVLSQEMQDAVEVWLSEPI